MGFVSLQRAGRGSRPGIGSRGSRQAERGSSQAAAGRQAFQFHPFILLLASFGACVFCSLVVGGVVISVNVDTTYIIHKLLG